MGKEDPTTRTNESVVDGDCAKGCSVKVGSSIDEHGDVLVCYIDGETG